jgi:UDP-glucose 4-epimerase
MSLHAASTQILVTGGIGFIGSHICISLIKSGFKVVCLDNLSNSETNNLEPILGSPELKLINGDIRSIEDCEKAMKGCTHVCHLAAISSVLGSSDEELMETNLQGTRNLVKCAIKNEISMFVFSSSCAIYGDAEPPITLDTRLNPISTYGKSKMMAEELIQNSGLNYRILRYFNVYGPRQRSDSPYSAVIPIFFNKLFAGLPATLYGNGKQTRDFIHVDEVVSANLSALNEEGESIQNIGTGKATSIAELLEQIQRIMVECNSGLLMEEPVFTAARDGEIQHSWCGDATATISLEAGLKSTIFAFLEEAE